MPGTRIPPALRAGFGGATLMLASASAVFAAPQPGAPSPLPERVLRVLVLRSSGKPLAGAKLSFFPAPPYGLPWSELVPPRGPAEPGTSDARGEASLPTTSTRGALLVEHESGLGAFLPEVLVDALVRVDVVPCGSLEARGPAGAEPAPELDLDLLALAPDGTRVAIGTRRARTLVLPPGRWLYSGLLGQRLCDGLAELASGQRVVLDPLPAEAELHVALPVEGTWSVRLPGATRELPRDADGRVRVPGGNDLRRIVVRGSSSGATTFDEVWLEPSAARPFRYSAPVFASTPVLVRSAEGRPLPGALVVGLQRSGDRVVPRCLGHSDEAGRAMLVREARPVPTTFCVLADGHAFVATTALLSDTLHTVTLPTSVQVTVRTKALGGAPVAGAHFLVRDAAEGWFVRRLVTGPLGTTTIPGIGPQRLEFELDEAGTVKTREDRDFGAAAAPRDREVVLLVAPGANVRGRVFSADDRPVRGVAVTLRDTTGTTGVRARHALSDAEGRFVFEGLPDHLFTLSGTLESGGRTLSGEVRGVQPGDDEWRIEVRSEDPVPPGRKDGR